MNLFTKQKWIHRHRRQIYGYQSGGGEINQECWINIYTVLQGFPGGAVVKNPPANAGDKGSSPGPGRSHMPWSN